MQTHTNSRRSVALRLILGAALLLLGGIAAACNKGPKEGAGDSPGVNISDGNKSGKAPKPSELANMDIAERIALGRELSWFKGTPLSSDVPDAVDLSRDGNTLFVHGKNQTSGDFYVARIPVLEDALGPGQVMIEDPQLIRTFVAAHPRGKEAIGAEYFQSSRQSPIVDLYSRFSPDFPEEAEGRSNVPYNLVPGFPMEQLGESAMDVSPFYNWVGDKVIVPLKQLGVCIVPVSGTNFRYVPYPDFPGGFGGLAMGNLPDDRKNQYLWLSMWIAQGPKDTCRIFVLDLQTEKWQQVAELDWVVNDIGTSSVWDNPWLISGSRSPAASNAEGEYYAPQEGQTGVRVPKLGRLIPGTGMTEMVPYQGNPVWDVGIDPTGSYIAYMDRRRHAMVRVEPATGKVDIDPRWWTDDTELKVFVSEGGGSVLFWRSDILIRGKWTEHDDGTGYEEALPSTDVENDDDIRPSAADLPEEDPAAETEDASGK